MRCTQTTTRRDYSHFDSLHLHSPGVGSLVEHALHGARDGVSVGQDLAEVLGSQHVSQGSCSQQFGAAVGVLHVGD